MSVEVSTAIVTIETQDLVALPSSKAEQIRATFGPMADMLQAFEGAYAEIMTEAELGVTRDLSNRARRLRLDIAKVRVQAEKARVNIKAEYLLASKAIDGVNNILKWAVSQKEEALEGIERHAERLEAERLGRLQNDRAKALAPFVADAGERNLAGMDTDVWDAYLAAKQREHVDRIEAQRQAEAARIEAARKREEEQAAIRAERDRLAEQAARLEAEAAAKEAARQKELARLESERKKERERAEAESRRVETARQAELAKIEAERQKERQAAEVDRRRREELEAAERERTAKEQEKAKERAQAEAAAAKAPVRKRLVAWVDSFALPELAGTDDPAAASVRQRFVAFQAWARAEVAR